MEMAEFMHRFICRRSLHLTPLLCMLWFTLVLGIIISMPQFQRHDYLGSTYKIILLAEDNEGDIELIRYCCEHNSNPHSLFVVHNGEDVIAFLKQADNRPDIILLDINMPRMNGHEVLEELKQDPDLCDIPVVMLTSSGASADVEKARENGASGYIVKSNAFETAEIFSLIELVKEKPDTFIRVGLKR